MYRFLKIFTLISLLIGLCAVPALADWADADGHKMHFPQHPDPNGWDVMATEPMSLADDWECSESGMIKDLHFWGSWKDDNIGQVVGFLITIHDNIPDGGQGFSIPGQMLWGPMMIEDYVVRPVDPPSMQGWYDPANGEIIPNNHQQYFQYNIFLPQQMWFPQVQGQIYWLRISAFVVDPVNTHWGWKSTQEHFMDDAVMAPFPDSPDGPWYELYEPDIPLPPIFNAFHIAIDPSGQFLDGFGEDAYGDGWYYYENFEWWNVWFYDHPLDFSRMKHVFINGNIQKFEPSLPSWIEIAVNWSTPDNPPGGPPPVPPIPPDLEPLLIGRATVFEMQDYEGPIDGLFHEILEYNPEWVSVDIRGYNFIFDGVIEHACLPREPQQQSLDLAFVVTGGPAEGVPTLNEWGMLLLLLLLISAGTVALVRRRREVTARG